MSATASPGGEFAIRLPAVHVLFAPFDARPVAERQLDDDVRLHLLDEWDRVRDSRPSTLIVYAPAGDRAATDEAAVSIAVRANLRAHTRLRHVRPVSRRDKITGWAGIIVFLLSIAVSTSLDRISSDVLVAGVSQAIVVIGWVALWAPAERVVMDIVPHYFARGRYAELADIPLRFVWQGLPDPAAQASASEPGGDRDGHRRGCEHERRRWI